MEESILAAWALPEQSLRLSQRLAPRHVLTLRLSLALAIGLSSFIFTQNADGTTIEAQTDQTLIARTDAIEHLLSNPMLSYASLDRLVRDYQLWQNFGVAISPPGTNTAFYIQRGKFRVFDPTGFPTQVLSGLIPEIYREAGIVYRVTIGEDPETRDRVLYNAYGEEIWRQAPPENYDPWRYLRYSRPWALTQNTVAAQRLRATYDPSRIWGEYLLMSVDDVPDYAASIASIISTNQAQTFNRMSMMSLVAQYVPAPDAFVFTDFTYTNGVADMDIHLPDGTSCRVDIFSKTSLLTAFWSLAATTATQSNTFHVQLACTWSNAFFRAGNADIDTDGDGIPDGREILMYGTDPTKTDTDGDGMSDDWELANGHNPLDPNDPPNVSGTIIYSGRQTGSIWVVAVTSSNSWSTSNAVHIASPGSYLIPNLPGSNYYLKAWMDTTSNGVLDATEAFGAFIQTSTSTSMTAIRGMPPASPRRP